MSNTLPTYFISHGGGPWPWVPQMRDFFAPLEASLKQMIADHGARPKAILMISGHWEEDDVAIMGAAKPPMEVMYPQADMPIFQVSMLKSYDPADHLSIGRALRPLRDEGIMIVGSGLSFHNLRLMRGAGAEPSAEFDAWLYDAMMPAPDARRQAMLDWESAPAARICHAEEDHLVPIFVALGAAEDESAERIYHHTSDMTGITVSNYKFG